MDDGLGISREGWLRLAVRVVALVALVAICGPGFAGVMADGATNQATIEGMTGNGTSDDPYVITNATQLQAMEEDLGAHYELGNDIDASNTTEWNDGKGFEPVGNESDPIDGNAGLDGRGHTIDGLTIDRPDEDNVGLIGYTSGTTSEIEISNVTVTNATVVGNDRVGILAGYPYFGPDISNVHVQGSVTGTDYVGGVVGQMYVGDLTDVSVNTTVTGRNDVGGLGGFVRTDGQDISVESTVDGKNRVGGVFGTTENPTSNVSVTTDVTGTSDVGGLAGFTSRSYDQTRNASASGTVTGTTNVGGLVGQTTVTDVVDSSASATVHGGQNVGGLVGNVSDADRDGALRATVRNSTATGDVHGEQYVGGLVGVINGGDYFGGELSHGLVTDSSATGDVYAANEHYDGDEYVGGLVGIMRDSPDGDASPHVQDSWASGTIAGDGTQPVMAGGLVGSVDTGTVARSSAVGDVDGNIEVGGLVGNNSGTITTSRASGHVDGNEIVGGLVPVNTGTGTVEHSSSTARVDGGPQWDTGGVVGLNFGGEVTDSWAAGSVSGGGDLGGVVGDDRGTVTDSYWDVNVTGQSGGVDGDPNYPGVTGLATAEMTGPAAEGNMTDLEFPGTWETTNRYPHLAWQPAFDVVVEDADTSITAGETITVTVTVTNTGEMADGQEVWLTDTGFEDRERDSTTVALEPVESTTVTLEWATDAGDVGDGAVTVSTPDDEATETVTVDDPAPAPGPLPPPAPADAPSLVLGGHAGPITVVPGETATASTTVGNDGGRSATGAVRLVVDSEDVDANRRDAFEDAYSLADEGFVLANETVSLDAGEETTVALSIDAVDGLPPGTYEYAIRTADDASSGTLRVREASEPDWDLSVETRPADGDSRAAIEATVTNVGDAEGSVVVAFDAGEASDEESITLAPGDSTTVAFDGLDASAAPEIEWVVTVGDASESGTLTAEDLSTAARGDGDGVPGFGPIATLVALAAAVSVTRRRLRG
ncbi:beta strand repeat-containing protein [Halovivax cerinus]|uniref:Beta strand repeat-containing protein n=1 Tax=Halovivax cerinus TaxID=1487865 RepID=A0ABD5NPJ9_9EURY|nr:GLUG motif-containing protein [Halovivax cerinus]